ncbi:MAG: hypothetical protein IT245_06740 [Bacteroidia bacterium]|nr:hypothetical protein [Bacteroidia bacterium]
MNFFQWLFGIKPKKKEKPKYICASGRCKNRRCLSDEINQGYLDVPIPESDPFGIHYVDNNETTSDQQNNDSNDFSGFGGGSGGGGGATSSWDDNSSSSFESGSCDSGGGDGGGGGD